MYFSFHGCVGGVGKMLLNASDIHLLPMHSRIFSTMKGQEMQQCDGIRPTE